MVNLALIYPLKMNLLLCGVLFNLKVEKNPFILMNGDILTDINYLDLFNFHQNENLF